MTTSWKKVKIRSVQDIFNQFTEDEVENMIRERIEQKKQKIEEIMKKRHSSLKKKKSSKKTKTETIEE